MTTTRAWTLGLLAGGKSRRFGRDKASTPFGPEKATLLERAVARLAPPGIPVLLSTRPGGPGTDSGLRLVHDQILGEGPLIGTLELLRACETDWLLVVPVDAPMLPGALGATMCGAAGDHDLVLLAEEGQRSPLPLMLRKTLLPKLERLVADGARRMIAVQEIARVHELSAKAAFPGWTSDAIFLNVNTPEDLQRAEGLLRESPPPPVQDPSRRS